MKTCDLIVTNIKNLVTVSTNGKNHAKTKEEMSDLAILKNASIAVEDGKIVAVAHVKEISKNFKAKTEIDADQKLVCPGFVDSHTHMVYAGLRDKDLKLRLNGASYLEILEAGGGINSTVKATREMDFNTLYEESLHKLKNILKHGTTTIEIKSGYGLDYDTEEKILKVIKKLKSLKLADVVSTYLGAHTFPKEMSREAYLNLIIDKCLPDFKNLADYCDVYSETGAFSKDEASKILNRAKELGYKLKIHSGQFTNNGSTTVASNLGAVSADHLDFVSDSDINNMKNNNTSAVLMPQANFYLFSKNYPKARNFIDAGVITSLATDYNPGSAPGFSMQFVIALAVLYMGMSIEEAITASTINSAFSIGLNEKLGSIEVGKQADIIIFDIVEPIEIAYYFGTNLVNTVIKKGTRIS